MLTYPYLPSAPIHMAHGGQSCIHDIRPRQRRGINTVNTDSTINGEQCVSYTCNILSTSTHCRLKCII